VLIASEESQIGNGNEEAKDRSGLATFPQLNRNENFPANRWTALLQAATMTGAKFTAVYFT